MTQEGVDIPIGVDLSGIKSAMVALRGSLTGINTQFSGIATGVDSLKQTVAATTTLDGSRAIASLEGIQVSLGNVSSMASEANWNAQRLANAFTVVGVAAKPLALVPGQLGVIGSTAGLAATGAMAVAGAFGTISTLAVYAGAGISVLIAPLRGLVVIPKLIAASFSMMFAVVLAPFRALAAVVKVTASALWMVLKPIVMLSAAIFKMKMFIASLQIQFKILATVFGMMSPKVKLLVGSLIALGAASRVSATATNLLARGLGLAVFAAMAVKNPIQAAGYAAVKSALAIRRMARAIGRSTIALVKFTAAKAVAGMKRLASASRNVASAIGGKLMSILKTGALAIGTLAAAGAGWGIKLAADAEQAEIAFTTMLKSGDAAKAVLTELETFAASTPFQLDSLRDGAKQLLNAGVPADQLTAKLTQLGDIAAGTGKPIGDFVRIFAKVKATGKVSLESLNQLAERGVPIYSALQTQLGGSRQEMLDMISKGKVGFTDLNAALASTATGAGVFAGGMAAQSQSISGLFSTLKDNVGFAMRELGGEIISAFDFKGLMATSISLFQSLKAGIASARPAFVATAAVVKTAFGAVWEVVTVVFDSITSALGMTGGNFMASFMEWAAIAVWAMKEWPTIAELGFTKLQLWLVQAGANFAHLFTGVLPALFSWFTENWSSIFLDAAAFVGVVFANIGKNIMNAMTVIWDFIASGGTSSLEFAFTPILDGFGTAISKLPDIPERAVGALEKSLSSHSDTLANALGGSLAAEIDANMQMLDDFQSQVVETPTIPAITAEGDQTQDEGDTSSGRSDFTVDSLDRGSEAALKAIFAAGSGDTVADKTLNVTKSIDKGIQALVKKKTPQVAEAGAE